jgi:hypothetical protein
MHKSFLKIVNKLIYKSGEILMLENPIPTSMGVFLGVTLQEFINEILKLSVPKLYYLSGGIFLCNMPTLANHYKMKKTIKPEILRAFDYIETTQNKLKIKDKELIKKLDEMKINLIEEIIDKEKKNLTENDIEKLENRKEKSKNV